MEGNMWRKRITNRTDMVARITHLTKGVSDEDAFDNFSKTEPNNIDDWRQGYMYGLKEGRLREIKDIKEMVLKNR